MGDDCISINLNAGERLLRKGRAKWITTVVDVYGRHDVVVRGTLFLTNMRLVFKKDWYIVGAGLPGQVDIWLSRVDSVRVGEAVYKWGFGSIRFGQGMGFTVVTTDGSKYRFATGDETEAWLKALREVG